MRKRFGIREGTAFTITARNNMIVLKKLQIGLSEQDLKSLKLIEEAWKEIEQGRYRAMPKKSFLKELEEW
jgi:bifunctional DNA-binding transcriptional regulator/antitoxin component of YhaV-PrlF toxin-antitoxin module